MTDRLQQLEESVAHLNRLVDDLSDIIARQGDDIRQLTRRQTVLMEREAERQAASGGSVALGDQRPPHW